MTELRSYQRQAVEHFAPRRAGLIGHDMGLGKTLTAITLIEGWGARGVIVLAPLSATTVWRPEFRKHAEDWMVWAGEVPGRNGTPLSNPSVAARAAALENFVAAARAAGRPYAVVVNYEASWRMAKTLMHLGADVLVLDEVHRCKAPGGKASRFVAKLQGQVDHVLGLSGTPASHSPLDLYGVCRSLGVTLTWPPTYRVFCEQFGLAELIYTPGGVQRIIYRDLRPGAEELLYRRMDGLLHRVSAEDAALDLPGETDQTIPIELSPTTSRAYRELERDLIAEHEGSVITAANAMVLGLRLAQITSGATRDADTGDVVMIGNEKEIALGDLLEDLDEPVVVFCRFRSDLDAVERVAAKLKRSYGELSGRRRDALTRDGTMAEVDVAAVQIQSGGVGINLTRARVAIYFSMSYSLSDYLQSRARLHRPGQDRPVLFIRLTARGTIDEDIVEALDRREEVVERIIRRLSVKEAITQ